MSGRPYLRRNVVRCAAERFRRLVAQDALLAHAEIGYLNVPVHVQQHVVQLQIAVHDAPRVQIKQPDSNLRRVEPGERSWW